MNDESKSRKFKNIVSSAVIIIIILTVISNFSANMDDRSYKITDFDINAVIQDNGDTSVEEVTEYSFKGMYNGITITIPCDVNNYDYSYYENGINDTKLLDSLYNNNGLEDVKIYVQNGDGTYYEVNRVGYATNGMEGVYTQTESNGYVTYKIYTRSTNENKTFKINYTLKDVAVKHEDVAEFYWNFIGGKVESKIDNLNINVKLSENANKNTDLKAYLHGPSGGTLTVVSNSEVKFNYKNIKPYQYVATRIVFDKNMLINSNKYSGEYALPTILSSEENLQKIIDNKNNLKLFTIGFAVLVLIYWLILLLKYEKEKNILIDFPDYMNLLDEYNPMIAACIVQNRDMHPRDIIAVLVNLSNKNFVKIEARKTLDNVEDLVTYKLEENKDYIHDESKLSTLDEIEKRVLDIFFCESNEHSIDLETHIENITNSPLIIDKVKSLDEMVTNKLYSIGANIIRIPKAIKIINNIIFILICIFIVCQGMYELSLNTTTLSGSEPWYIYIWPMLGFIPFIFVLFKLVGYIIYIIIFILNKLGKKIDQISFKISGKKLYKTTIKISIIFGIIILLAAIILRKDYIIYDIILFTIGLILISTDDLMSNHSMSILKKYFGLKMLADDIVHGSLLKEKAIQDKILWDKYLSFAIALGVTDVSEYSKYISIGENLDITKLLSTTIAVTDGFYALYNVDRQFKSRVRLNNFSEKFESIMDTYSSTFHSSGGSSSFGGGGFSGGGGGGGRKRSFLN